MRQLLIRLSPVRLRLEGRQFVGAVAVTIGVLWLGAYALGLWPLY